MRAEGPAYPSTPHMVLALALDIHRKCQATGYYTPFTRASTPLPLPASKKL